MLSTGSQLIASIFCEPLSSWWRESRELTHFVWRGPTGPRQTKCVRWSENLINEVLLVVALYSRHFISNAFYTTLKLWLNLWDMLVKVTGRSRQTAKLCDVLWLSRIVLGADCAIFGFIDIFSMFVLLLPSSFFAYSLLSLWLYLGARALLWFRAVAQSVVKAAASTVLNANFRRLISMSLNFWV